MKSSKLSELFLIKCGNDWKRTFVGTLQKCKDENDNDIVRCKVVINEGYVIGMAHTREQLGNNLDEICKMKLDFELHDTKLKVTELLGFQMSYN